MHCSSFLVWKSGKCFEGILF